VKDSRQDMVAVMHLIEVVHLVKVVVCLIEVVVLSVHWPIYLYVSIFTYFTII